MAEPPAVRRSGRPLAGKVALVAGATRGAGRGIARMLGEAGATVYCSGRSTAQQPATPRGIAGDVATGFRPETIEETAAMVDAAGGRGIAVRTDHTVAAEVAATVARIRSEQGRLDLLVNDVWGGDGAVAWGKPFWETPYESFPMLVERALLSHILTAHQAAPLLIETARQHGRALLVEVTDGDSWMYRGNLLYDLVKTSIIRLAFGLSKELAPHGVVALAVTPGFLRSEAMLEHFGVTEANWRDGARREPDFIASETPSFVGRAIASLAADPNVAAKSGRVIASWTLGREYGFKDDDGTRPDWGAHFAKRYGSVMRPLDDSFWDYWEGWDELKAMMAQPPPNA